MVRLAVSTVNKGKTTHYQLLKKDLKGGVCVFGEDERGGIGLEYWEQLVVADEEVI